MSNTEGETLWVLFWLIAYLNLFARSCSLDIASRYTATGGEAPQVLCKMLLFKSVAEQGSNGKQDYWAHRSQVYVLKYLHLEDLQQIDPQKQVSVQYSEDPNPDGCPAVLHRLPQKVSILLRYFGLVTDIGEVFNMGLIQHTAKLHFKKLYTV